MRHYIHHIPEKTWPIKEKSGIGPWNVFRRSCTIILNMVGRILKDSSVWKMLTIHKINLYINNRVLTI